MEMSKKRLICVLLVLCIMLSSSLPIFALAKESKEFKPVTLSLYSNLSSDEHISGLYSDNILYIPLEDVCKLTGGQVKAETEKEAVVTLGNGTREFVISIGSGNMAETLYSDKYNITMPSLIQDGQVYVSALHFLRYVGATVQVDENSPVQFMVIKRYDIFDALSELASSDCGNFFWWDEVDTSNESLKNKLTNAGVVALINRDSNIFRMMLDARGIEQEAIEDALLSIVKNEGQGYFTENTTESELIETASGIIGAEADWFDLIKEAYADGSDVLGDQISDLASSAAITAGFANNVVKAVESLKQFDNMSIVQKNVLSKTILDHPKDSKTLCDGWDVVFDAAQNVNKKIQSEYDAQYKTALKVAESTAYDFLNGATGAAGANPVSIAWSGINLLTKMIPLTNELIGKKEQLYNGYNSSIIQLIANEMMVESYSEWYYNNGLYTMSTEQYEKLEAIKQLMILQLKSTLTTRECIIRSNFLEDSYAAEMEDMNRETAFLLNRVENCKITGVNLFSAEYKDDLSWMEYFENSESDIFGQLPQGFDFSSGAGAWGTHIDLNPDGTFTGQYHDTEMGDTGSGYPNGTVYICNFDGKFSIPKQLDEYTYSMRLEYLNTDGIPGNEYYENNMRYVYSEPYGFDYADEFLIYLPGIQIADLPDGFVSWLNAFLDVQATEILPYYGIYNMGGEEGFVAYMQ